jgi:MoxR-like ATPase
MIPQTFSDFEIKKMEKLKLVLSEIKKVIVGQDYVLNRLLLGLLSDGHILLEGVPGLAKTMMVRSLAKSVKSDFRRIQFTPDLLPADLIGTKVFDPKKTEFVTKKGPIFANFVLADEINRAPPKVQSALLEAMQERRVTIGGETYSLPKPFLVLATQNPIEIEGTYPLPEAQIDRFMFKINVDYPNKEEEKAIIDRMASGSRSEVEYVLTPRELLELQRLVYKVYVDEKVKNYIVDIVFASRKPADYGLDELNDIIEYGASPRASIYMTLAAKANALMEGRSYTIPDDVKEVAPDILRHRIILSYEALVEELSVESVLNKIFEAIEVP